jgi:hypothetical protein
VLQRVVEQIEAIAVAAYLIGAHAAMTDTSKVFFGRSRALHARTARATKPEEQRLGEAIEAEIGGASSEHPYKDAVAILNAVNKRLAPQTVKVDKIYRRLKARRRRSPPRS